MMCTMMFKNIHFAKIFHQLNIIYKRPTCLFSLHNLFYPAHHNNKRIFYLFLIQSSIFLDRSIRKLANLNLTLGYFASLNCMVTTYGICISALGLNTDPWIWLTIQTMFRVTELAMVSVALYTVRCPYFLVKLSCCKDA